MRYQYVWKGRTYASDIVSLAENSYSDYRDAHEALQEIVETQPLECRVNPNNPTQAKLRNQSMWGQLGIVGFIMIFVLIGLAVFYGGVRMAFFKPKGKPPKLAKPRGKRSGVIGGIIFGGIFFLAGLLMFYMMWLGPVLKQQAAKDWKEVPCKVKYSKLRSHKGDDSTTYSVDVFLRVRCGQLCLQI